MPELRVILIIIGAVVILGVYLWGRRRTPEQQAMEDDWLEELARRKREGITPSRKAPSAPVQKRVEPSLGQANKTNPIQQPVTDDLPPMRAQAKAAVETTVSDSLPAPKTPLKKKPQAATEAPRKSQRTATKADSPDKKEEMILVLFIMAPRGRKLEGMDIVAAAKQVNLQLTDLNVFQMYDDADNKTPLFTLASMLEPGSFDLDHLETYETPGLALFCQLPTTISGSAAFEKMLAVGRHMAQALNAELKDESRSTLTLQTIGHIREKVKNFDFRQQQGSAH